MLPDGFVGFVDQQLLLNFHDLGTLADVERTLDRVRDTGDTCHQLLYELGLLDGVAVGFRFKQVSLKLQKVLRLLRDVGVERIRAYRLQVGVGVLAFWQHHNLDVHTLFQDQPHPAQRRFDTRDVPIVEYFDVFGVPLDKLYLLYGQRSTGRSHYVFNACLMQRNDIRIAFHHNALVLLADSLLGKISAVQDLALVVNIRFRRVDILGRLDVLGQYPPAEANHFTRQAVNSKHDTIAEKIPPVLRGQA